MDFQNKKCIVTGVASGIGQIVTQRLLQEGALVFGIDIAAQPSINHESFTFCLADLSKADDVKSTFLQAEELFGHIDLYVANAGQARYGSSLILGETDKSLMIDLNINAVVQAFQLMRISHGDAAFAFLGMSSVMADWPLPGYAFYAATKAAAANYLKGVRHELTKGQEVYIVYPVATQTNFFVTSGQTHKSWMTQTPEFVAGKIINGLKKGKQNIHPSFLFKIARKLFPFALQVYVKREIALLKNK